MKMSAKLRLFICVLQIISLYSILIIATNDLEVTVELDTSKLEDLVGDDNQLQGNNNLINDDKSDGNQLNEEHLKAISKEDKTVHTNEPSSTNDVQIEHLNLKSGQDVKKEQGFSLTPEEMQKFKIWKDGDIPYYIDVISFSDKVLRDSIRSFLRMVNDVTGLNFEEMPNPPSNDNERWVFFINRRGLLGCADHNVKNFTNQGVQKVVLGYDCLATKGELAEAVMSIVGVPAQHNAPDRDKYIKVNTKNIMPDKIHLFKKLRDNEWLFHELEYDWNSVTHYDVHKYSVNGRATIEPMKSSKDLVPVKSLSSTDILKIKMLYNYITSSKKLQVPECEKLFKPRNKYDRFIPNKDTVKPRKKPSRYLGKADNDDKNIDKSVGQDEKDKNNEKEAAKNQDKEDNDKSNESNNGQDKEEGKYENEDANDQDKEDNDKSNESNNGQDREEGKHENEDANDQDKEDNDKNNESNNGQDEEEGKHENEDANDEDKEDNDKNNESNNGQDEEEGKHENEDANDRDKKDDSQGTKVNKLTGRPGKSRLNFKKQTTTDLLLLLSDYETD